MHLFLAHPLRDDHMKSFDLAPHADRVQVPVLSLEAFQDQGHHRRAAATTSPGSIRPCCGRCRRNGRHDMYLASDFQANGRDFSTDS